MAVTGVFQADFSSFQVAVDKAEVQLRSFEGGAAKVESALSRMTDTFSGRRVISEATQMAEVLNRAGTTAKFTESELARMGAVGAEAVAKMRALGQDVPEKLQRLAGAAEGVTGPTSSMTSAYRQFDGVLQSMGVNIGPQVKGIEDMTNAAGKSASQIGLVGSAGLVLGAAIGGWGIGRAVANFFDLDKTIAATTARLLGFGDVAAQTAGAKADTLAKASDNAGRQITDMAEAIRINQEAIKTATASYVDWDARLANAQALVEKLTDSEIANIQVARGLGATQAQLQHDFGLTADGVKALDDVLKVQANNAKKIAEVDKQLAAQRAKDAEDNLKREERVAAQQGKLLAENTALAISMSGTVKQARIADIEAEYHAAVSALTRRNELTADTDAALQVHRDLLLQKELVNFDLLARTSRTTLEERAAYEQATLEEMGARGSEFSARQIQQQREVALAARDAARSWRDGFVEAADQVVAKADDTARRVKEAQAQTTFSSDIGALTGYARQDAINRFHVAGEGFGEAGDNAALQRALKQLTALEGTYAPKNNDQFFAMQKDQVLLAQLRNTPQAQAGYGLTVNVKVDGPMLGTQDELGRFVGQAVLDAARSGGARFSGAGA